MTNQQQPPTAPEGALPTVERQAIQIVQTWRAIDEAQRTDALLRYYIVLAIKDNVKQERARVHPVDDARVMEIRMAQELRKLQVLPETVRPRYSGMFADIDYLLSLLPQLSGSEPQDWCDHCSGDLNDIKHILCDQCYRDFAQKINTREMLRGRILDWLAHRCDRSPVCGNCTYCRVAHFVRAIEDAAPVSSSERRCGECGKDSLDSIHDADSGQIGEHHFVSAIKVVFSATGAGEGEREDWVTFGRVKVDIENETETFERIHPPALATAPVVEAPQDERCCPHPESVCYKVCNNCWLAMPWREDGREFQHKPYPYACGEHNEKLVTVVSTATPNESAATAAREIVTAWLWQTSEGDQQRARIDIERRLKSIFAPVEATGEGVE